MTLKDFAKKSFRHSEKIIYTHPYNGNSVECMLLAIDFEQQLFKLYPFDTETYEPDPIWVRVEYCEKPPRKLKILK